MKVTDEMVEAACLRDQVTDVTPEDRKHMKCVLEAAVGDLSEPNGECWKTLDYLAAAEAKLAKVREWADNHQMGPRMKEELLAILDEP